MKIEFFYKETGEIVEDQDSLFVTCAGDVYYAYFGYSYYGSEEYQFEKINDIGWRVVED